MSDILQIGLVVVGFIVYLFIGLFLSGLMCYDSVCVGVVDDDDMLSEIMFMLFWPLIIVVSILFALAWAMMNLVERPVNFVKGLGVKLADKIKSVFEKKKKDKINKHYVEFDTRCDKCDRLQECLKDDNLLDVTNTNDSRKHYIRAMGAVCKMDEETLKAAMEKMGYPEGYYPESIEELREVCEKMEEMISNESNGISGCDEVKEDEKNAE